MVRAGMVFREAGDTVRVPYLAPLGIRYRVGSTATLVAFFYVDSVALARDLAPLDAAHLAPKGDSSGAWASKPSVIRSGNLVTALFDASATQIERIELAITAGAPLRASAPATITLPLVPNARPVPNARR